MARKHQKNFGNVCQGQTIDFVDLIVCLKIILHISLAWFGQPSTETVKQLPSFQIDFGGKIKW